MKELRSMSDILRRLALADPQKVFEALEDAHGLTRIDAWREPVMLDYDGDETRADSALHVRLDGTPVTIAHYPYGTITASIGTDHMTVVRRERQGHRFAESFYVYEEVLERFRATGRFGEIEEHDPQSFLDLLGEHRILEEFSLAPEGDPCDRDYVSFLREHDAPASVVDAD
jgi:hypothetical protein